MTNKSSNEFDALSQYGKNIQILILARVNGYYSPYSSQTIMEEEAKSGYGDVFIVAEREFFKHRFITVFPYVTKKGIAASFAFLEQQKLANCPCLVHTEQRGFKWVVFRRQPDKITSKCGNIPEIEDDVTDDEDYFFSAEADESTNVPTSEDEGTHPSNHPDETNENPEEALGSSEQTTFASADLSDGYKTIAKPQRSKSSCDKFLHSRDTTISSKILKTAQKRQKSRGHYYNPLVYYIGVTDKTYYYQYFKPYSHDYRKLKNELECQCPRDKRYHIDCSWYHPKIIYILDTKGGLSTSEQAAQKKISTTCTKVPFTTHLNIVLVELLLQ